MALAIRRCGAADVGAILAVVNDAAEAYRGVIPADCWHEPYMPEADLRREIGADVVFWCTEEGGEGGEDGEMVGVMGLQDRGQVTLIRHAYVLTARRNRGIGGTLLEALRAKAERSLLVGTWAAAAWAVRFYQKHGFRLVTKDDKDRLLATYWSIPERQIETSVVLADERWWRSRGC